MNFILYIKCKEEQDFSYENPLFEALKNEIFNADFLDLDNFSGQDLMDLACKAIIEADKTCVVFDFKSRNTIHKFLNLATSLADNPSSKRIFIVGEDQVVSKLLPPATEFSYHNLEVKEQLTIIKNFMK